MRINTKNDHKSWFTQLAELIIKHEVKKNQSQRLDRNEENHKLLELSQHFKDKIDHIRKSLKVPQLDQKLDMREWVASVGDDDQVIVSSIWLDKKGEETKKLLDKYIKKLIKEFELSPQFYDWLQFYILYSKPKWNVSGNLILPFEVVEYQDEIKEWQLNTQDKKYIRKINRELVKDTYDKKVILNEVNTILRKSKNRRRKIRTLSSAGGILKAGEKYTFNDLVVKKFPNGDGSDDKKISARFRKQKERLAKRLHRKKKN